MSEVARIVAEVLLDHSDYGTDDGETECTCVCGAVLWREGDEVDAVDVYGLHVGQVVAEHLADQPCTKHTHGDLKCTLKAGHKYGPVFESSQTEDRHRGN